MVEVQAAPAPRRRGRADAAALLLRGVLSPEVADRCADELGRITDPSRRVGGVLELLRALDVDDAALAKLLGERLGWERRDVALALGTDEGTVAGWLADPPDAPRLPAHHVDPTLVHRNSTAVQILARRVAERIVTTQAAPGRRTGRTAVVLAGLVLLVLGGLGVRSLLDGPGVTGLAVDDGPSPAVAPEDAEGAEDPVGDETAPTDAEDEGTSDLPEGDADPADDEPPLAEGAWRPAGPTPTEAVLTTSDPRSDIAAGDEVATEDGRVWLVVRVEPAEVDHIVRTDWASAGGDTATRYVLVPRGAEEFAIRSPLDLVVVPGTLTATADDTTDDTPGVGAAIVVSGR